MTMTVKFWGVRGSVASPGPETARVGGNTSCVVVQVDGARIICDAGTGLRRLGATLAGSPLDATLLLSHLHWDHIQGLPFFAPVYSPATRLTVISGHGGGDARDALHQQMRAPTFPVDLRSVPASLSFVHAREREDIAVGAATVRAVRGNHPDGVFAYRVEAGGRSVVYATDTEHYACVDPRLRELARGADLLIYDAQYLPEEYSGRSGAARVGWGHSTWEAAVELAEAAEVGALSLFHHDPSRVDDAVMAIEAKARRRFGETFAAVEGMALEVGAREAWRAA